jgi:DNA-directed RNA polymerase specialized sigma24 family protein
LNHTHPVPPARSGEANRAAAGHDRARWAALAAQARAAAAAVLRLPRTHPDVEDRAQDALVALLASGLPRFDRSRGTPEALLGVIARNCAVSHLRSRATHALAAERLCAELAGPAASDSGHRRVEASRDLARILGRLRADHAEALVRIDLQGERIGEAAARLGRTYTAVNAEVGHARSFARRVARELAAA